MAYNDLREWIAALERAGELKRIKTEVDPVLEIAEITDRVSKGNFADEGARATLKPGGPALLFENPKGSDIPVLINQFGSERRMRMALGVDSLDEVADRIRQFMDVKSPQGFLDKIKMLPMLAEMGKFFPKTLATGPCKEVIRKENFDLKHLPILQCWPQDAGRFITLPCVVTRDPKTGKRNVGMYRMQVYDGQSTGMHWQRQKIGAEHYREMLRREAAHQSQSPPCRKHRDKGGAPSRLFFLLSESFFSRYHGPDFGRFGDSRRQVACGKNGSCSCHRHRSALTFSAIVPAPPDVEEYLIAGFLRQSPGRTGEMRNRGP